MILVDGSQGEGGGQVLRTALALSVLTEKPARIENIRVRRSNPGLRPQHLTAVKAAAAICAAHTEGADLESRTLEFVPGGPARAGNYTFDVAQIAGRGSAGSVVLVLQTVLMPLAMANGTSRITLRGGTHVPWAPSFDYLRSVFLPTVADMGVTAEAALDRWGFYPVGQGQVQIRIVGRAGQPLRPLTLTERGAVRQVGGRAVAANLPSHIPQRMVNRTRNLLTEAGLRTNLHPERVRGAGPGAGIFLFVEYEHAVAGFTAYGRKGLPSERVAEAACEDLLAYHHTGRPVDPHLADQLALPMALAEGASSIAISAITHHLLTNLAVLRTFMPVDVEVEGEPDRPGRMRITGSRHD